MRHKLNRAPAFGRVRLRSVPFLLLGLFAALAVARAGDHHEAPAGISASKAFTEMKAGNKRFVSGEARHPAQDAETRKKLAGGQTPHTIVLSCSDSRVPPELVFDQGLGQIFTVRVAGNYLDPATVASIEYAVDHLGSKLIVVMGHESCGAVKAALSTPPGKSAGSKDLDQLVSAIRPNLGKYRTIATEDKTVRAPVKANVEAVAQDLMIRSKIVRRHVEHDGLVIVPAIYGLGDGTVEFWKTQKLD